MANTLHLITDTLTYYIPNPDKSGLKRINDSIIFKPEGKSLLLGFVDHRKTKEIPSLVQKAVELNFAIIYLCTKLPENPIIDEHIIYLIADDTWFIHTLFRNPTEFSGVFYSKATKIKAKAFSVFTQYTIPILHSEKSLVALSDKSETSKKNLLVEIYGGLGDHLMCIPTLKTLAQKGFNVYVLTDKHRQDAFFNLDYIKGFYSKRNQVDLSDFCKIVYFNFGQILNDYRQDFNKQNRIYSIAHLAGISPNELIIDKPEIIFSKEEINSFGKKWHPYNKKIFIGTDSNRVDAKMPPDIAQTVINKLKSKGFTVFTSSCRDSKLQNCINLSKQLSTRELFGLISQMDYVLTVDSSFLHISAAFNVKTFALMNYFKSSWRTSTYTACSSYNPKVSCFPCCAKQFISPEDYGCKNQSCYSYFDFDKILEDICSDKPQKQKTISVFDNTTLHPSPVDQQELAKYIKNFRFVPQEKSDKKRIATFWMGGLGDSIMLTYLCRSIKRKHPDAIVTAVIRDKDKIPLFSLDKDITAISSNLGWKETVRKYKNDFDLAYEFSRYPVIWKKDIPISKFDAQLYSDWGKASSIILSESNKNIYSYYAEKLDLPLKKEDEYFSFPDFPEQYYSKKLALYRLPEKFITFHIGSDSGLAKMKMWDEEKYAELFRRLKETGINVVQVGKESDPDLFHFKREVPRNILELLYILKRSSLHIDCEGGLVHAAHSVKTKSVVLFGATNPILYGYEDNINLYKASCPSCWWQAPKWSQSCKLGLTSCKNLDEISVEEVFNIVLGEINDKKN